jgi:cytochrome c oxidase cbb3-type subunit 1
VNQPSLNPPKSGPSAEATPPPSGWPNWSTEEIDASGRWPLLVLFAKGTGWLVLGVCLLLIVSVKLHGPGFLSGSAWLGLGRLKPAALNALVYGFACPFAFGTSLWILCRLGRTPLLNAPFLFLAGAVWNVGVFLGIIGILGGASTGYPYLEMPRVAWPFVFVALGLIALWGLLTFHYRRPRPLYVSQWYLVAALFWFPWVLSAAVLLLLVQPVRGVMQAVVGAWYVHNLFNLWLTPVGLAALYYFIPKLTGQPLFSRETALFAFWTLAIFGGWGGLVRLSGGPFPSWMISLSIAGSVLMVVPLVASVANLCLTMLGRFGLAKEDLVLRFMLSGGAAYVLAGMLNIVTSFRTVAQITLFTYLPMLIDHLVLLGFFGMVCSGAAYFIIPKVTRTEWPSPKLVRWHWYGSVVGLAIYAVALLAGGWVLGNRLNNPEIEITQALKSSVPWVGVSTLGLLVFLAGQLAFLINLQRLAWRCLTPVWAPLWTLCCGETAEASQGKAES